MTDDTGNRLKHTQHNCLGGDGQKREKKRKKDVYGLGWVGLGLLNNLILKYFKKKKKE